MLIGLRECVLLRETRMSIIDGPTVLTKANRDSIIDSSISTLACKNKSFTRYRDLMDESLCLECIDNTIECRQIHPWLSFFPDEPLFEIRKCDTIILGKELDKSFAWLCDTRLRHRERRLKR